MLTRKTYAQKTVRMEENVMECLESLSEILGRTQNELVNIAIENLIKCNKVWMAKDIVHYYFKVFLENGGTKETHDFDLFKVTITGNEDDSYDTTVTFENGEQETYHFNDYGAPLKDYLRRLADDLDQDSALVQNYLKGRLNFQ